MIHLSFPLIFLNKSFSVTLIEIFGLVKHSLWCHLPDVRFLIICIALNIVTFVFTNRKYNKTILSFKHSVQKLSLMFCGLSSAKDIAVYIW